MNIERHQEPMTEAEARASVDEAKRSLTRAAECIVEQVERQAWLALGYPDWPTMREAEYDGAAFIVKSKDRKALIERMSAAGLTQREIATTAGVSVGTVNGDLRRSELNAPSAETCWACKGSGEVDATLHALLEKYKAAVGPIENPVKIPDTVEGAVTRLKQLSDARIEMLQGVIPLAVQVGDFKGARRYMDELEELMR